jgi:hypothetical protein
MDLQPGCFLADLTRGMLPQRDTISAPAGMLRLSRVGAALTSRRNVQTSANQSLAALPQLLREYRAAEIPVITVARMDLQLAETRSAA